MDTAGVGPQLGRFWAAVIGGEHRASDQDPVGSVVAPAGGPVDGLGITMCAVPETKTVKHRVHLDVYTAAVADLEALGAKVLLPADVSGFPWTVMSDPEGGEFCAFVKEPLPDYRLHGVVVDCVDPERAARWWGERFGIAPSDNGGRGFWTLNGVTPDPVMTIDFVPVPEPKTIKNRIHWDVHGDPAALESAGATRLWDQPRWVTLADPEGNEFCVFGG
jgi:predicted enzyme related to lactoylglutathione lyase